MRRQRIQPGPRISDHKETDTLESNSTEVVPAEVNSAASASKDPIKEFLSGFGLDGFGGWGILLLILAVLFIFDVDIPFFPLKTNANNK